MRTCSICKIEKPLDDFEKMPKKKHGRGYRCNECNRLRHYPGFQLPDLEKTCPVCGVVFIGKRASRVYCSKTCNAALEPDRMAKPKRYFQSMLNPQRIKDGLTAEQLLAKLEEQDGKCALTGREMTFIRGQKAVDTNCSIDRIEAGGTYSIENVQLVCAAVNGFRRNLPLDVFIGWCEDVAKRRGGRN